MMAFIGGILFTCFILFLGVKVQRLKIEYGDFREPKSTGGTASGGTPRDTKIK